MKEGEIFGLEVCEGIQALLLAPEGRVEHPVMRQHRVQERLLVLAVAVVGLGLLLGQREDLGRDGQLREGEYEVAEEHREAVGIAEQHEPKTVAGRRKGEVSDVDCHARLLSHVPLLVETQL